MTYYYSSLPDERKDFAADIKLASLLVSHDALGSGHDSNTEALHYLRHILAVRVDSQTGLGNTAEAGDYLSSSVCVLEIDSDDALLLVVNNLEALDVALVLKDLSYLLLEVGRGDINSASRSLRYGFS